MRIFFLLTVLLYFIICCSNPTPATNEKLSQPPYQQLTDSIKILPGNAELFYRRGILLYNNQLMDDAEKDFRTAWRIEPKETYALSLASLLRQKNIDTALYFLYEASKKLPDNISLQIGMARAYQQKNNWDSATQICNAILKRFPGQLDALLLKADLLQQQNKDMEALELLETAYTYAPGDPELVHMLAFEYAESKNGKVIALADSLIRADVEKRHAEPYYFKGVYYANMAQYSDAIRQFDEAIRHDFNFLGAYLNKGIVYYDLKKYDQAITTFELAIKVDPSFAEAFYWLGKSYEARGNKSEAKSNYLKAYGLDQNLVKAKESAANL